MWALGDEVFRAPGISRICGHGENGGAVLTQSLDLDALQRNILL